MKKVLFIVAALVATFTANAGNFRVGGNLGMNISNMKMEGLSPDSKVGFKIGVIGEYQINPNFSVAPELNFEQKGCKFDIFGSSIKTELNYLYVPINFVGRLPINNDFSVFGFAGPEFGYALSGKTAGIDVFKSPASMERLDAGLDFGVGAEYKNFFLRVQYNLGLMDVSKSSSNESDNESYDEESSSSSTIKNRNFSISLGYMFNLGK